MLIIASKYLVMINFMQLHYIGVSFTEFQSCYFSLGVRFHPEKIEKTFCISFTKQTAQSVTFLFYFFLFAIQVFEHNNPLSIIKTIFKRT